MMENKIFEKKYVENRFGQKKNDPTEIPVERYQKKKSTLPNCSDH